MRHAVAAVAPVVAVGLVLAASPPAGRLVHAERGGAHDTPALPGSGWGAVMDRAIEASRGSAYEGRLVIVAFDEHGPTVTEVDVVQGPDGAMRVGRAEAWMVGRDRDDAFFFRREAGHLLRFGNVERIGFDRGELTRKYDVRRTGVEVLPSGPATVLAVRERGGVHDRERLFVDDATGIVVRRETFAADGAPRRVVAFTELRVAEPGTAGLAVAPTPGLAAVDGGAGQSVSDEGLRILGEVGWAAPAELPAGFRLRRGYALPQPAASSLHLVYSDGLYTLSIYQQVGLLDTDAVAGARSHVADGRHVWRWPGSEPERLVWSDGGRTYTAVSDAPVDALLPALAGLPGEPPPALDQRLGRGLHRVVNWLWPFD